MLNPTRYERPQFSDQPQIANARADFADLSPVSLAPYYSLIANYIALTPGQAVPLIWEEVTPDAIEK
jgi:hypothetical protein